MLPVIAGVVLETPKRRSNIVKMLLPLGIAALLGGFISHASTLFLLASVLLGGALLYISITMLSRLLRLTHHSASSKGMLFALVSLAILVLLALYLTLTYAQLTEGIYFVQIKQLHYSFGLFGWVALLIASISFQTIEMFYVTPPYPKLLSGYLPLTLFALLLLMGICLGLDSSLIYVPQALLYSALVLFAIWTLLRLSQRKRPLADATMWFWRMGMGSLMVSMMLLLVDLQTGVLIVRQLAAIFFVSFALSVLFAMLYKIIPFLTWFHLNAQGYFTAPMMHEVIHPKTAKKHFWIHLCMVVLFLSALWVPALIFLASLVMVLSFGWIGYQVHHASTLYRHTQETGEKFDMEVME